MSPAAILGLAAETQKQVPGFIYMPVNETWLRRYVPIGLLHTQVGVVLKMFEEGKLT